MEGTRFMIWIKVAGFLMFMAVALGAFGAHALKAHLAEPMLETYRTAVLYHFIHALGLFAIAWMKTITPDPKVDLAGLLLVGGIVLFSGSLYALAITGFRALGMLTPIGGLFFLAGWITVMLTKF